MKVVLRAMFLGLVAGGILFYGIAPAGQALAAEPSNVEAALAEAEEMMLNPPPPPDIMPVSESEYDGYWWNKQDRKTKQDYVKQLIELFGAKDKKLKINTIIAKMDVIYDPKDDPADIKIDKSVERIFYGLIKEIESQE